MRIFPVWPQEMDARFGKLRAYGVFLVFSELKDSVVQYVPNTNCGQRSHQIYLRGFTELSTRELTHENFSTDDALLVYGGRRICRPE
jgi:hypothetical protein